MENSQRLKYMVITEIKKSLCFLPITVIGTVLCICLDTLNQIPYLWTSKNILDVRYYWFNSFVFGGFYSVYVVPVLACIPYSLSFCNEYNCNVYHQILIRGSTKIYCITKIITSILVGGLSVMGGGIAFVCLANYFVPLVNRDKFAEYRGLPYFDLLQQGNGILFFVANIYLLFLTGILWSLVSLVISAFIPNKYVTISIPLMLSFFLTRLYVIIKTPEYLRLDLWLRGRSMIKDDSSTLFLCTVVIVLLSVFLGTIFYKRVKRRVQNE